MLLYFVRKKNEFPYRNIFWLFAAFIFLCGTTHFIDAVMFWWPAYRLNGLVLFTTGAVSWATVFTLYRIIPTALTLRSTSELDSLLRERTQELLDIKHAIDESTIVLILDKKGMISYVNEAYCRISKYSTDELIGQSHHMLRSSYHSREFYADLWRTITRGKVWKGEIKNTAKDGTDFWLDITVTPIKDNTGKPQQYISIQHDITERKNNAERYWENIINCIADPIFVKDDQHRWVTMNDSLCQMLGEQRENLLGKSDYDFFPKSEADVFWQKDEEVLKSGDEVVNEEEITDVHGIVHTIVTKKTLYQNSQGENFVVGVSRDVTDYKRIESEILTLNTELEQKVIERTRELECSREEALQASRMKSEFLANMSHEIRTPLNGVLGMTDIALKTDLTPDQQKYLKMVKTSGEVLLTVINDVLDFSKIEAGRMELDPVEFDFRDSINDTIILFSQKASEKDIELKYTVSPDIPKKIMGDPMRLRQVLTNLVSNAVKFTHDGSVTVKVDLASKVDNQICLQFSVSDTGIGLTTEQQQKIFEPFTQADASMTRKYGGTGLGLSIALRLINLMQGRLWVESNLGSGSTFYFKACFSEPKMDSHTPQVMSSQIQPEDSQGSMEVPLKILLAEDSEINQAVASHMLVEAGHTVDIANNGNEVLQKLKVHAYDVILMDVHMPEMNGFETTAAIRELETSLMTRLPIIALTANALTGDKEKCLLAGMDGYVSKPFKQNELLAAIASILPVNSKGKVPKKFASGFEQKDEGSKFNIEPDTLLYQFSANPNILFKSITMFRTSASALLTELEEAIETEDEAKTYQLAHKLKGEVANFTVLGPYALLVLLETQCLEKNWDDTKLTFNSVKMQTEDLLNKLEEIKYSKHKETV